MYVCVLDVDVDVDVVLLPEFISVVVCFCFCLCGLVWGVSGVVASFSIFSYQTEWSDEYNGIFGLEESSHRLKEAGSSFDEGRGRRGRQE